MKTRLIPNEERDLSTAGRFRKLARVIKAPWARSLVLLGMTACFVWLLLPNPPLLDGVSYSECVRDRDVKLLRVALTSDQNFRVWTSLRDISPELIDATLRYEDKYFARHPGVNPIALLRSGFGALRGGARSGASTITMQLARLRFQLQTRTPTGKFIQIVRALELERHYSKSEILEVYLNLAPYGRNIEGIGAASQIYFGKTAARLTGPESISLSVIPQSPTRRALHADRDNRSLNAAQENWYDRTTLDEKSSAREFSARAEAERTFLAPHFVQQVLSSTGTQNGVDRISVRGGAGSITTTLDLQKQQLIERRI